MLFKEELLSDLLEEDGRDIEDERHINLEWGTWVLFLHL